MIKERTKHQNNNSVCLNDSGRILSVSLRRSLHKPYCGSKIRNSETHEDRNTFSRFYRRLLNNAVVSRDRPPEEQESRTGQQGVVGQKTVNVTT